MEKQNKNHNDFKFFDDKKDETLKSNEKKESFSNVGKENHQQSFKPNDEPLKSNFHSNQKNKEAFRFRNEQKETFEKSSTTDDNKEKFRYSDESERFHNETKNDDFQKKSHTKFNESFDDEKSSKSNNDGQSSKYKDYDDVHATMDNKKQLKDKKLHEKSTKKQKKALKHYDKTPTKKKVRVGTYTKERADKKTGETYTEVKKGIYIKEQKLAKGQRNLKQKMQYQAFHQPKQMIKKDIVQDEYKEGNDAVQMVHSGETFVKNKVVKPFVRDHFGFDKHQTKQLKYEKKANKLNAKAEVQKEISEKVKGSSNAFSKSIQKKQIKNRIYKEHGLKQSIGQRIKGGIKGVYHFFNPFYQVKMVWHGITTLVGMFFALVQFVLTLAGGFLILLIPIICVVSILSFFFGGGDVDPNILMADVIKTWSEELVDIRMELVEADKNERYKNYDADEVRIYGSLSMDTQEESLRQVQLLGYLSAFYQEELVEMDLNKQVKNIFKDLYSIQVHEFVDEGKWEKVHIGNDEDGKPIYEWKRKEHWVLYLKLERKDFDEYAQKHLNEIANNDERELALLQYSQYQETYGLGQVGCNVLGKENLKDWRKLISSPYGWRILGNQKEFHEGIDIAIPTGTPLVAMGDGKVTGVNRNPNGNAAGIYVIYEMEISGVTYEVKYFHLDECLVRVGEEIKEGELIAYSGNTGRSTGPHLHLQTEIDNKTINPLLLVEFPGS
jgi:murein DD-endopeptidase MepM/ murein hydrolase activator NlpD